MTDSFPAPAPEGVEPDTPGDPSEDSETRSRKTIWIVAAALILIAGAAGLWLGTSQRRADDAQSDAASEARTAEAFDEEDETPEDVELAPGELYFAGADSRLHAERRELPAGTPAERARALVAALLDGPEGESSSGLWSPLPQGARIEAVYLLGTTAVLDLRPPEPTDLRDTDPAAAEPVGPPTPVQARLQKLSFGSKQELLAVYSLVNTVVLGVEGVDSVQLLWDGSQPETFAGHVDTTRPLAADPSYLAPR